MGFVDHTSVNRWGLKDNPGPDTRGSVQHCRGHTATAQQIQGQESRNNTSKGSRCGALYPDLVLSLRGHV